MKEPDFDDLLTGDAPTGMQELPDDRPEKELVFIERTEDFFNEVDKLSKAVVVHCKNYPLLVEVHQIVKMAVDTGLVRQEEIRVAKLAGERFLIHLPRGLEVPTFIKAFPHDLWAQGLSFQPWSQTEGTNTIIPRFKVLVDLVNLPALLWEENEVIKVAARMGVYLGSVAPEHMSDLSAWRFAVATDDLRRIPKNLGIVAGGIEHPVQIKVVKWKAGPLYSATDFPAQPRWFTAPPPPPPGYFWRDNGLIGF